MDLKVQAKTAELLFQLTKNKENTISFIEYFPQKEAFPRKGKIKQPFPRTAPERQGISSAYMTEFLQALERETEINMHSILVMRNGRVIAEGAFSPYQMNMWHVTHSMCKSITALAIGILIGEGKLSIEDKLVKIFDKRVNPLRFLKLKNITIYHLLTMTSGIVFGEQGAVTENDWIKGYLESNVRFEAGEQFYYNSMNTYILSAIVKEITGQGLMEYLKPRLWEPLGIEMVYWELCPKGLEKGGWGLYLCPEDMAKIGQLFLQRGVWKGVRLISEEWISEMCAKQVDTPPNMGKYGYGYQIWISGRKESFQCNGMLGQNIIVYPDIEMVIVTTAGSNELFQESRLYDLIHQYFEKNFTPEAELPEKKADYERLLYIQNHLKIRNVKDTYNWKQDSQHTSLGVKNENTQYWIYQELKKNRFKNQNTNNGMIELGGWKPQRRLRRSYFYRNSALPIECKYLNQTGYELEKSCVGLMPLFIQVFHSNYSRGIHQVNFRTQEEVFFIDFLESDELISVPVGFRKPEYSEINLSEEIYAIGTTGEFSVNEDEILVLKININFIETSNTRLIKFFLYGDTIIIKWNEKPGKDLITEALNSLKGSSSKKNVINLLMGKTDADYMDFKVRDAIEPETMGKLIDRS